MPGIFYSCDVCNEYGYKESNKLYITHFKYCLIGEYNIGVHLHLGDVKYFLKDYLNASK